MPASKDKDRIKELEDALRQSLEWFSQQRRNRATSEDDKTIPDDNASAIENRIISALRLSNASAAFPIGTVARTSNGDSRLGIVTDITQIDNKPPYFTLTDINTGNIFHRTKDELTTRSVYKITDYRLEANLHNGRLPAHRPWALEIDATLFGVFMTLTHPDHGRAHIAVEIDGETILIHPTRDPEIQPDLALRVSRTGSAIEPIAKNNRLSTI